MCLALCEINNILNKFKSGLAHLASVTEANFQLKPNCVGLRRQTE